MRHGDTIRQDMRSAHSRHAFAALDNLIDRHYIMSMRQKEQMEKIFILIENDPETGNVGIVGTYDTYQDAQEEAGYLMDFNNDFKYYEIREEKVTQ